MSRPPRARELVLEAFQGILAADGERAATLDATARAAGVSKGGLLYHFASKEALEAALVDHLSALVDEDVQQIVSAPGGVVDHYIRSSVMEGSPLDRAVLAVARLAQGGNAVAAAALRDMRDRWADAVRPHVRDEAALNVVLLVSDGLYFNNLLDDGAGPVPTGAELDTLIALVESATRL